MPKQNHRIRRQVFELSFGEQEGAYGLMEQVKASFKAQVLPALEQLFEQYDQPGKIIRLDKLSLNLGKIREDHFREDIKEAVLKKVEEELQRIAHEPREDEGEMILPSSQGEREILEAFLRKGLLPWWARAWSETPKEIFLRLLEEDPGRLLQYLHTWIAEDHVRLRIARQFGFATTLKVGELLGRAGVSEAPQLLDWLSKVMHWAGITPPPQKKTEETIGTIVLSQAFAGSPAKSGSFLGFAIPELIQKLFGKTDRERMTKVLFAWYFQKELKSKKIKNLSAKAVLAHFRRAEWFALREDTGKLWQDFRSKVSEDVLIGLLETLKKDRVNLPADSEALLNEEEISEGKHKNLRDKSSKNEPNISADEFMAALERNGNKTGEEGDQFYLNHAGIILAHPFLPTLFESLGFTEDGVFHEEDAAIFAAGLIQYIATGELEFEEHELALAKVLCGLTPAVPAPEEFTFTESQLQAADEMLEVLIDYWPGIGKAVPESLRVSFFAREGRLTGDEGQWDLMIQRKTEDILVDQITWSLSMVKLPWMEQFLYSEW